MIKLQRTIGIEGAKSRIPGLFAYIGHSEYGGYELHKATDNPQGCYGMVVEAITVPYQLTVNDEVIMNAGEVYTYREIMNAYYAYRDVVGKEDLFIRFVNKGIGRIYTRSEAKKRGIQIDEGANLVPETLYMSSAMLLWMQMEMLRKSCVMYNKLLSQGEDNKDLCCDCDRYRRMGGENMQQLLEELAAEADEIAGEYLERAAYNRGHFSIQVPLYQRISDIGYYNTLTPEEEEEGETGEKKIEVINTCSELTSLRDGTYLDSFGNEERPEIGEDWLFYYKIGTIKNLTTNIDEDGNIALLPDEEEAETDESGQYHINLDAYGDVIHKITPDKDNCTITIEYIIGAHLKAKIDPDENGDGTSNGDNTKRYYSGFAWDESTKGCRYYEETYSYYKGGELDMAAQSPSNITNVEKTRDAEIEGEVYTITYKVDYSLDNYIKGYAEPTDISATEQLPTGKKAKDYVADRFEIPYVLTKDENDNIVPLSKLPFSTFEKLVTSERYLGSGYGTSTYVQSSYKTTIPMVEMEVLGMIKDDTLMHMTHEPTINNGVYIKRGDNAAFERHIKLSEIKTMSDLMIYSNGGYYNVQSLN